MSKIKYSIVSVCTYNYKDAFDFVIDSWLRSSAENIYIYTDTDKWKSDNDRVKIINIFNNSNDWVVNVGRKCKAIKHFINNFDKDNAVLFDIDCYIHKDVADLFEKDFDLAISRIEKGRMLSSGVIFIKNNERVRKFIDKWDKTQNKFFKYKKFTQKNRGAYDQKALHVITYKAIDDKSVKILPIGYTEYSFKVKNLDEWLKYANKKWSKKEVSKRLSEYKTKRAMNIRTKDVRVLHFYNNSYRDKNTVRTIFSLLEKKE